MALDETPHQERPCVGAVQVGESSAGRASHPRPKVRVAVRQQPGSAATLGLGGRGDAQTGDVLEVGSQQIIRRTDDPGHDRHRGAPRRARVYSAIKASGERCT
jgi:hypothetical protein